jgi:hypothetical protein
MKKLLIALIMSFLPLAVYAQNCPDTLSACPHPSYSAITVGSGPNTLNGSTISLGGNLTTSGANPLTFTTTGTTNVTLPTSGTLVNSSGTMSGGLFTAGSITSTTINSSTIGSTSPGTGAFTTLSATQGVTGIGFQNGGCLNIMNYGGDNGGATDNTTAMNAALAALPTTGGCVYFPAGKYKFLSAISYSFPSGTYSLTILGAGQDSSILYWPSTNGLTVSENGTGGSVHIRGLAFTTGSTSGAFNGLSISNNVSAVAVGQSDLQNLVFRGDNAYSSNTEYWGTGTLLTALGNVNALNDLWYGSGGNGTGLEITGTASLVTIISNITQCTALSNKYNLYLGTNVQGITISESNFGNGLNGIYQPPSVLGGDQLAVSDSQFGGNTGDDVVLNSNFAGVSFTNDNFSVGASVNGINLQGAEPWFTVVGSVFGGFSTSTGILSSVASQPATISANAFKGIATGINWPVSAGLSSVGNSFNSVTTNFTNTTGNFILTMSGPNEWPSITVDGSSTFGATPSSGGSNTITLFNGSSSAGTNAVVNLVTGTSNANAQIQQADGSTPTLNISSGSGDTGGILINPLSGNLNVSAVISPSTTKGIKGTTLADNAQAGSDGEFLTANTASVSLTAGTTTNGTSESLTAGDWNVQCVTNYIPAGTTIPNTLSGGVSTTSATLGVYGNNYELVATLATGQQQIFSTPMVRENISSTTTVYCPIVANFTVSTMTASTTITARRVR